jgi:hypothetical protein
LGAFSAKLMIRRSDCVLPLHRFCYISYPEDVRQLLHGERVCASTVTGGMKIKLADMMKIENKKDADKKAAATATAETKETPTAAAASSSSSTPAGQKVVQPVTEEKVTNRTCNAAKAPATTSGTPNQTTASTPPQGAMEAVSPFTRFYRSMGNGSRDML